MPVPSITPPTTPRLISAGSAFSLSLSASNTPSSWAVTGTLPSGITFNTSTGVFSGTPALSAGGSAYALSITATNGDGTSSAVSLALWVLPAASGQAAASDMALLVDWDWQTGQLSVPSLAGPEPGAFPPSFAESKPLFAVKVGDRRQLSVGIARSGVLFEPDDLTVLKATLKRDETEPGVELTVDSADITVTSSGDTARHEVMIYLTESAFAAWLAENEQADRAALREAGSPVQPQTFTHALLELVAEIQADARNFSTTASQSITLLNADETENHTFSVALTDQITTPVEYEVTATFTCPSDTALSNSLTVTVTVHWNGSAFVVDSVSPSVPVSDANNSGTLSGGNWPVTFSIQSVTGDAAGFDVAVRAVAGSRTANRQVDVSVPSPYQPTSDEIGTTLPSVTLAAFTAGDVQVGSTVTVPSSPSTWDASTAATALAAFGATFHSVTIGSGSISIYLTPATTIAYVQVDDGTDQTDLSLIVLTTYNNTSFGLSVEGQAMESAVQRITSLSAPVILVRRLTSIA